MSKLGVIATLVRKNCGYEGDQRQVADIPIGTRFEVENISVGQSHTNVYLEGHKGVFNSVHFKFTDDNGNPVNIFRDVRFNPYIQYKMEIPDIERPIRKPEIVCDSAEFNLDMVKNQLGGN